MKRSGFDAIIAVYVGLIALIVGFWATVIAVAWHFIAKLW